jgi:hypothetical protein
MVGYAIQRVRGCTDGPRATCRSLRVEMAATPTFGVASMCASALHPRGRRGRRSRAWVSADRRFGAPADQRCNTVDGGGGGGGGGRRLRNLHAIVHGLHETLDSRHWSGAILAECRVGRRLNRQCGGRDAEARGRRAAVKSTPSARTYTVEPKIRLSTVGWVSSAATTVGGGGPLATVRLMHRLDER